MVGTLRLSVAENDNTNNEHEALESCTQSTVPGSCNEHICPANMTSLMSLEDQPHQVRENTNLYLSSDYFQPWSLDAFLVRSVESVLFSCAPDRESIYDAAESGDVTAVDNFLDAGINIEARRDGDGLTPLLAAARFGQQEVCETLLRRGADVAATTSSLSSPLHEAALNGKAICCQLFLAAGGDPNSKDTDGQTPLHLAALGGHTATVRLLLAAGANHSVTTTIDDTPLHLAVDRGHDAVCRILMQHGATPRQVSPKRKFSFPAPGWCSASSKKHFVNSNKVISSY